MKNYSIEELEAMNQQEFTQYIAEVTANAKYDEDDKCINVECHNKKRINPSWNSVPQPLWDFNNFFYRIKPEPQYKPYKVTKSEWVGKAVIEKSNGGVHLIGNLYTNKHWGIYVVNYGERNLQEMFELFTWSDGTPFGERIEE